MKALVLLLVLAVGVCSTAEKIVCYFSSWAVYRPEPGSYDVDDIDPHLCTHLIFSFAGLSNYTWQIEVLDPWNELCPPEGNNCAYKRFVALKDFNPSLTILLAIGGWNEGSEDYSRMAEDPSKRATFVRSAVSLLHLHGFEGLDFDWEYPTQRGGAPQDKENFITLMTELKEAFDASSPRLILTGALAAGKSIIDEAYDMERLIPLFDQLHIMAYDYHGCFETFTHHNAPLCGYYADTGDMAYFNVNFTVSYYLDLGVPKDKLVMGTPLYGRCYTLDNFDEHGMLAPAHSCGAAGPYVRIPGTMAANEICERLKRDRSCTVVHDPNLHEPYFYCMSDYLWCGYDDADSLYLKARYVKNLGLAGVVIWTMDEDDFHGMCYDETSHLIKHMKEALDKEAGGDEIRCDSPPLPTTIPTTTTTTPTTTSTTTTTSPTTTTTTTPTTSTTTTTPTTTSTTTTTPTTTSTTTTTPTTTTTTPTTTSTTTTTTPTTTTTTTTTTIMPGPTTTPSPFARPNCTGVAEGTYFAHMDCDKYWECEHGGATLGSCAPGTLFDITIPGCNWEDEVDKSQCRYWSCQIENLKYPAENCDEYYECEHGAPILRSCNTPLYWNQQIGNCDRRENVDTSLCNEPDY